MLNPPEALDDSLGVVNAIYADAEQAGFDAKFGKKCGTLLPDAAPFRYGRGWIGEGHADRDTAAHA